ncbi:MAG: TIGR00730 family Rossman fold protein [Bacteroidia bacterium]|nr:TIGR00730 family Rossman fold protein [Bacteroidia bacterium]MDW8133673.1 TIGR00730 family Rossman fold protein [Bacteroidia bacterium]
MIPPTDGLPRNLFNKTRDLREKRATDTWQIFRIMAEFVEGFEKLSRIGPCVSIFGSARAKPGSPHYELAVEVARALVENGYGIITGGGPGIMEAANKGAKELGGHSVGLNIILPFEQHPNPYVDEDLLMNFDYFFVRKVMFVKYAQAFVVLPGGYGTMDELFEALTLIQTRKIERFPVVMVGSKFWEGLVQWLEKTVLEEWKYLAEEDRLLFTLVDTPNQVVETINNFYRQRFEQLQLG